MLSSEELFFKEVEELLNGELFEDKVSQGDRFKAELLKKIPLKRELVLEGSS